MKVLLWQTAFLGDVILTVPLINAIRKHLRPQVLTYVGRPFILEVLKDMGLNLIPFSKGFGESLRIPSKISGHDIAIVPHRSLRTALIILFSQIPVRIGFDRSELKFAFNRIVKHRWEVHEVYRNLELLKPLGIEVQDPDLRIPFPRDEVKEVIDRFGLKEKDYIVVSPFSNFPLKEPDQEVWKELIEKLKGLRIVITGTSSDKHRARELEEIPGVINLVGRTSLRQLMGILAGAKVLVSADSSPVHIANALGTPAVTLYTATSPRYGFYPFHGEYIENPAPCSPCSPNPRRCKTGTLECRTSISADSVLEVLKKFL